MLPSRNVGADGAGGATQATYNPQLQTANYIEGSGSVGISSMEALWGKWLLGLQHVRLFPCGL
mgnify:CR=1 FL=1